MSEKNLKTLNVSEDLHTTLKIQASKNKRTIQEELEEILRKGLEVSD